VRGEWCKVKYRRASRVEREGRGMRRERASRVRMMEEECEDEVAEGGEGERDEEGGHSTVIYPWPSSF
jgi:hypothetical protein